MHLARVARNWCVIERFTQLRDACPHILAVSVGRKVKRHTVAGRTKSVSVLLMR
jgi:hypothetical protein